MCNSANKSSKRELPVIADELRIALKRCTVGIIQMGGQLADAVIRVKVEGGAYCRGSSLSARCQSKQQRHLQARKFPKSRTMRDLQAAHNLSATAVYDLAAAASHPNDRVYKPEAITAIFDVG